MCVPRGSARLFRLLLLLLTSSSMSLSLCRAVILAQVFVLLHMVGAFQVFAQPFFVALEGRIFT